MKTGGFFGGKDGQTGDPDAFAAKLRWQRPEFARSK
jgi:hypothetical protein